MRRSRSLILACVSATACVTTTRLDPARPIEVRRGVLWDEFRQDGKPIADLLPRLMEHPAAGPRMGGWSAKFWSGMGLSAASGVLIGKGLTASPGQAFDYRPAYVGLGLFLLGAVPLAVSAGNQVGAAVQAYNESLLAAAAAPVPVDQPPRSPEQVTPRKSP